MPMAAVRTVATKLYHACMYAALANLVPLFIDIYIYIHMI